MPASPDTDARRWTIRRMNEHELNAVLRLALHNQTHGRPPRLLLVRALSDASTRALIARNSGSLAGYALMRLLPRQRLAYLNAIAVERLYRRQGLARRLLAALLAECRVLGIATVQLDVAEANRPARRLYEHFGFARTGVRPSAYADGSAAVQMTLALPTRLKPT